MYLRGTGSNAATSSPRANHDRRLLTAMVCRRSWTRGPWPRPPWGMRARAQEPAEVLVDVADRQWAPSGAGEQPVPAGAPGDAGVVVGQPVTQPGADRDLSVFAALAIADCQDPGVEVDVVEAQQPGFAGPQAAGVDRAEQHRHDQVPERDLRVVAAAVGLGEQGRQFLVGVDVRDVAGGARQCPGGQDVGRHAPAAQPAGQLPHRRGQAVQGRRGDSAPAGGRDPRLHRTPGGRLLPGEPGGGERGEPGQHPLLGVVCVTRGAFSGDQGGDRLGHRDGGAHRDTPFAGASGSSAHLASRPREDFR